MVSSCRKEMPALDRLQATLGGQDFEVVAISIDCDGPDAIKQFYAEAGIRHLAIHIDTTGKVGFALATMGLPATLLINRQGQELGRLIGPADWDAPDTVAYLRSVMARKQGSTGSQTEQVFDHIEFIVSLHCVQRSALPSNISKPAGKQPRPPYPG